MYILRYLCDKNSGDKSKYYVDVSTPTTVNITANVMYWLNTLYAADRFAGNTYYANIYTGANAGMSTYTSSQTFEFKESSYKWNLVAANSYGGRTEFAQAKGNGSFKVLNNWQIYFSDMEGKPKIFDAYFTAIKGGRGTMDE